MKIIEKNPPSAYAGRMNLLNEAKEIYECAKNQYPLNEKEKRVNLDSKINYIESLIQEEKNATRSVKYWGVFSITFLLSALIFTSFSLTGYSIGGLVENNFRFIGTGLFILGLIFAFLHFKMKGKK